MLKTIAALGLSLTLVASSNCAALGEHGGPSLQTVLHRVDVPRLLACADAGAPKDIARCLGAEAMTQGLQIALDKALELAQRAQAAGTPGAGAADLDDLGQERLASELDTALDQLAQEITATHRGA